MSSRWPTKSADAPVYDGEHCEHRHSLSVVRPNTVLGCQSGEEPSANQNRATFYVPREKPEECPRCFSFLSYGVTAFLAVKPSANQNVTFYVPRENPEEWPRCFSFLSYGVTG